MGQSSCDDVESSNVDMKKELELFWVHVDSKFAEILQAIVDLTKKVDAEHEKGDAFAYFGGLHMDCADLDVDENQGICGGDENVKDVKSNNGVGGSDSSKEVIGGGVGVGVGVGEENDSQSDFVFISVSESAIAVITQKYYTDKNGENEKVPDMNVNIHDLLDDEFLKHLIVTEQAREYVLPQRGDVEFAYADNESIDDGVAKGSEYVLASPPKDIARPQAEYLIENIEISIVNFDINGLRSRYGILLWYYGRQKQENRECNDSEDPGGGENKHAKRRRRLKTIFFSFCYDLAL
ncbi:hypothetical protein K7X08_022403 [Anisodus acutangulus]|uniref:Uncharacterized protein n=1 Tax=Anisodus acutangulus TaxID=402998 RepID=A0A9Q1MHY2_9SOLA|nr:hypothetical protein K7X08_022403 [Anisodus acutangulus]